MTSHLGLLMNVVGFPLILIVHKYVEAQNTICEAQSTEQLEVVTLTDFNLIWEFN